MYVKLIVLTAVFLVWCSSSKLSYSNKNNVHGEKMIECSYSRECVNSVFCDSASQES